MKFKKFMILPILAMGAVVFSSCIYKADKSNLEATPDIIPVTDESHNDPISGYCYVTFDANGTVFKNEQGQLEGPIRAFQVRRGHTWKRIKNNPNMPDEAGDCLDKTQLPNQEFQGWVTADNKHLFDNFVFNEDSVKINAKWGEIYDPDEFVTDSWDMFIQVAEKGYDELKEKYLPSFAHLYREEARENFFITDINDPEEVAAKTRYVEIEGLKNPLREDCKWPVQVVGVNHDLISGYNDKVATLTFQFSYAINPVIAFNPSSRELGSEVWETSTLRNYLDTTLMYQFDSELLSGLQTVSKNTDNGEEKDKISAIAEKVFLPSASEVLTKEKIGTEQKEYFNYKENSLYDFYRYHLENTFEDDRNYLLSYNPFDLDEESKPKQINTWLRSPAYANPSNVYQSFAGYLGLGYETKEAETATVNAYGIRTDIPLAVTPCFAVGMQDVPSVTLSGTNDIEMYGVNNFASKKEGYTAFMKMKYDSAYALPDADKITLTIDGVETSDFTFDSDGTCATLTINNDAIPECTLQNPTHHFDIRVTPIEDKFKSCSWEFLKETADKGWDALTETFERNSFIGNEKILTVDGVKYRVRVVQDYDPSEEWGVLVPSERADNLVGGGKAPLTFDFVTVVDDSPVAYDATTASDFIHSDLNSYLDDWSEKLDNATGGLAQVLKKASVWDASVEADRKWVSTEYETKAFVASYYELTGETADMDEGLQYQYYRDIYDDDTYAGKKAIVKYLDNEQLHPIDYWTRSPDWNDESGQQDAATYIEFDGDFDELELCSNKHYIAPAFCLGRDVTDSKIKFGGYGYTIDNQEPSDYSLTSRIGEQEVIDKIKVKQNTLGEYPLINEEDIVMTSVKEGTFTDYTLEEPMTPDGEYSITINHVPASDLYINIAIASSEYVSFNLIGGESTEIGFVKCQDAPDTEIQYSVDGGATWIDYTYTSQGEFDNTITLSSTGSKTVLFKADDSDGVPNTHFANVETTDEYMQVNGYTQFFNTDNVGEVSLSVAGNIMALLGNGQEVPTTIDASGAFAKMFAHDNYVNNIVDAGGLMFPAKGVSTSVPPTDASAIYAQMFYLNTSIVVPPAKIAGFNNFTEDTNVSFTYSQMFMGCENLVYAPQTDFSVAVPHMCNSMYSQCRSLLRADNSATGTFATKFAPMCFYNMFTACTSLVYGPTIIGSINEKAADYCCYNMFFGCNKLISVVSISCNEGADHSFENTFAYCTSLTHVIFNIVHLGLHEDVFRQCFNCPNDPGSLTDLSMPLLQLTSIDWPSQLMFIDWLAGQNKRGVLSCTQSVANALAGTEGASFIPKGWSLRVVNH